MVGQAANPGGTDDWLAVIEETRQALATLSADDLEALAVRAQALLEHVAGRARAGRTKRTAPLEQDMQRVEAGHRGLGDLLRATAGNLAVLRRLRDRRSQEANPPWAR